MGFLVERGVRREGGEVLLREELVLFSYQLYEEVCVWWDVDFDLILIFSFLASVFCVLMWVFNPLTDIQMASVHENSIRKIVDTTCFVTVWVITAFLCFEILNLATKDL